VLLEEPETLNVDLRQEEEAEAKAEAEKALPGLSIFTDGPRMEMGEPYMRWCGRTAKPGMAPSATWATTSRLTMRSAPLLPAHWNRCQEDSSQNV